MNEHWMMQVSVSLGVRARAVVELEDRSTKTYCSMWRRCFANPDANYLIGKLEVLRRMREERDARGRACPHIKYQRRIAALTLTGQGAASR